MTELSPDKILDLTGEICPYDLITARETLKQMNTGNILNVIITHQPSINTFRRIFFKEGEEVIQVIDNGDGKFEIWIKKRS